MEIIFKNFRLFGNQMPELNFSREVQPNLLTIRESEANEAEFHIHVLYYNRVTIEGFERKMAF